MHLLPPGYKTHVIVVMPIEERVVHPDGTVEVTIKKTAKDYFQYFMYFLRGLTMLMLAMNVAAFCIVIKIGVAASNLDALEKAFIVLSNAGFCIFCVVLVIAETQSMWFIKRITLLHFWGARGFLQSWMGIQIIAAVKTIGYAVAADTGGDSKALVTFCLVAGWMILSAGLLLMVMSALCIRSIVKLESDKDIECALLAFESGGTVINQKTVLHVDSMPSSPVASAAATDASDNKEAAAAAAALASVRKELETSEALSKNLAAALNISYVVARSRFGGPGGAAAADKFALELAKKDLPPL